MVFLADGLNSVSLFQIINENNRKVDRWKKRYFSSYLLVSVGKGFSTQSYHDVFLNENKLAYKDQSWYNSKTLDILSTGVSDTTREISIFSFSFLKLYRHYTVDSFKISPVSCLLCFIFWSLKWNFSQVRTGELTVRRLLFVILRNIFTTLIFLSIRRRESFSLNKES